LNLSHRYRFGRDARFSLIGEINAINVFNENNVTGVFNRIDAVNIIGTTLAAQGINFTSEVDAINYLLTKGISNEAQQFFKTNQASGLPRADGRYGLPNTFQAGRQIRFGFRFLF